MLKQGSIYEKSKRTTINVDKSEFESIYQKLNNTGYFKSNLQLFTIAALIGKFIVKKRKKIDNVNSFFRFESASSSDELEILKCLAICEVEDINILVDHDEIFTICEEYARTGIKELKKWYDDKDIIFEDKLYDVISEYYEE